jgi:hypothetical protein
MTVGRNYLPHGLHALEVAAAVNFTSTPGNKEIITLPQSGADWRLRILREGFALPGKAGAAIKPDSRQLLFPQLYPCMARISPGYWEKENEFSQLQHFAVTARINS